MTHPARIEQAPLAPLSPINGAAVGKRLAIWTAVCGIAAVPSFVVAWSDAHRAAMFIGVLLFIAVYVVISCTPLARRLYRKPFMKLSIFIGYGLRMAATAVFPYAWIGDFLPGMLAVKFSEELFGTQWSNFDHETVRAFIATLFTTIVQGLLLNIIVGIVITAIYFGQRLFRKNPQGIQPRGFEVLPVASLAGPESSPHRDSEVRP